MVLGKNVPGKDDTVIRKTTKTAYRKAGIAEEPKLKDTHTHKLTLMLPPDLVKELRRKAIDQGISVRAILEDCIKKYLRK